MRIVTLFIVGLVMAGCASPTIDANVTAFHTPELSNIRDKTIAIRADPPSRETSLEFLNYRPKIAAKLQHVGFDVVENASGPDYIARVSYGVEGTESHSSITPSPTFGFGYFGGGPVYYGGAINRSYNTRTWVDYNRYIALDIIEGETADRESPTRIYEGRAQSSGRCPTVAGVFDEMLDALFRDFPGANGKTVFITVPWDGSCE